MQKNLKKNLQFFTPYDILTFSVMNKTYLYKGMLIKTAFP